MRMETSSRLSPSREVKVGDTITHVDRPCADSIKGFEDVKPMVFAGVYPVDANDYEELRISMEKLQLNDASLTYEPESSAALGFGFRCGFLGLLHLDVIQERLQREFDIGLVISAPSVKYKVVLNEGKTIDVDNPCNWPDPTKIDSAADLQG